MRGATIADIYQLMSSVIVAASPLVETLALFSIWNWSRRQRSFGWLVLGWLLIAALVSFAVTTELPARAYAGYFGMYLFSALAWAWVCEGLNPRDWSITESVVAFAAVVLLSIATGGLG
jgi:small multidrug resistance family-3 protein